MCVFEHSNMYVMMIGDDELRSESEFVICLSFAVYQLSLGMLML